MMQYKGELWKINQLLIFLATFSIVLVILKFSAPLLVPFLVSMVLTIVLNPLLEKLEQRHIPKIVSMIMLIIVALVPIIFLAENIAVEVHSLTNNFDTLNNHLNATLKSSTEFFAHSKIPLSEISLIQLVEKSNMTSIVETLATQVSNQFSNIFLIFFTAGFMLMELESLQKKMRKIAEDNHRDVNKWLKIVQKIKSYFFIKVKTSLLTALCVAILLWFFKVKYLFLWVTLVFFLNFIPVIGSILAAIPAIILVAVDQNIEVALWVASGYLFINIIIGNILEPKIMGKGLGLSPLAIFISMTFWGWVFGPAGMILSVPLTMAMQFWFEQYEETAWLSLYFSDDELLHTEEKEDVNT